MAPIFHVNSDDPEAVIHATRIATEFRQEFGVDVILDIIGYRRFGHNEGDEPMFTQPKMYKKIKTHPTTRQIYATQLEREGVIGKGGGDQLVAEENKRLNAEFDAGINYKPNKADWLEGSWSGFESKGIVKPNIISGLPVKTLKDFGVKLSQIPEDFNINKKVQRVLQKRSRRNV